MGADYSKRNSSRWAGIGMTEGVVQAPYDSTSYEQYGKLRALDEASSTVHHTIGTLASLFNNGSDKTTGSTNIGWDPFLRDLERSRMCNPNEVIYPGPYLYRDHRLKPYSNYQDLPAGTIVWHTEERICNAKRGRRFSRKSGVYSSCCGKFAMKKRKCTDYLNRWRQLPGHDHVLPLLGVMTDGWNGFYEITNLMSGDLRRVTGNITLRQLADVQTVDQWTHTWRNFSHIVRSILKGVIHFNNHGFQHYDLKEDNVFVGKPLGCMCENILTCTCHEVWIIKIGDFDTLYGIKKPKSWYCGTKFYRPPESEEYYLRVSIPEYSSPVYDSWSIGVIVLHLCCGIAIREFENKVLNMPPVKYPECRYAKDLLLNQLVFGKTPRRLDPMIEFARSCIEVDFTRRPTPQELLEKWDQLCG